MSDFILLDMDGVLVDFVKGIIEIHDLQTTAEELYAGRPGYDIVEVVGMSGPAFWKPCDEEFWAKLDWMPDGREIFEIVESTFGRDRIKICTKPSPNYGCMPGKLRWIERHLPKHYKNPENFIFTGCKHASAKGNTLIDDSDSNVSEFRRAGGISYIVPRVWNQWHHLRNITVHHLRETFHVESKSVG